VLFRSDAAARAAKPEQFVDLTFMRELDSSGFIDQLYKPVAVAKATPVQPSAPVQVAREKPAPAETKTASTKPLPVASERAVATPAKAVQSASASAAPQEYVIKAGDTLSKLSERFYNSPDKWTKIFEANRESVRNPNYIYIGQRIVIPADDRAGT